ncbi:MAG: 3'(2'),5'-bisphosphate nucleotidase CysQ [Rhodospirillaceae bacterium]
MSSFPFSDTDLAALARRMRDLAVEAGAAIMPHFRSAALERRDKPDGTPVTAADLAANAVILAGLRASHPGIAAISEEEGSDVLTDPDRPFFLIDPLDGTKEFLNGSGQFTVNIALVVDRLPLLGVVYAPAIERLQWVRGPGDAVEEAPPHTADRIGALAPIRSRTADNAALTAVLSRSHMNPETRAYVARYAVAASSRAGSSLKFCLLAAGEADFYPRMGPTCEWDTAAAHAVLRAAGGRVAAYPQGEELRYGKPGLRNPFFIACGDGVNLLPA